MADAGPLTSAELAAKTKTTERYVREWLAAQAAGGFVIFDAPSGRYTLPPEQAMALADEDSPVFLPGFFQAVEAAIKGVPKIADAFLSGKGVGWHEQDTCLFAATERFFRPNYRAHLISEWIPALGDTESKLKAGARVADVGCGLGTSTILMAQAYPNSTFTGFDYHPHSIEMARRAAKAAGVSDRVTFEVAKRRRIIRARKTISSWRASIACTIWAIRRVLHGTCGRRSTRMEPGWSSSHLRTTSLRTIV